MENKRLLDLEQMQRLETFLLKKTVEVCEKHNIHYSLFCGSVIGAVRHQGPIPWDSDVDLVISVEDLEAFKQACKESLEEPLYLDSYPENKDYEYLFPRIGVRNMDTFWVHVDVFLYVALPEKREDFAAYFRTAAKLRERFHRKCNVRSRNRNPVKRALSTVRRQLRSWMVPESKQSIFDRYMAHSTSCSMEKAEWTTEIGCHRYGPEKTQFRKSWWEDTVLVPYEGLQVPIPRDYDAFLTGLYGDYMKFPPQEVQDETKNVTVAIDEQAYRWLQENGVL